MTGAISPRHTLTESALLLLLQARGALDLSVAHRDAGGARSRRHAVTIRLEEEYGLLRLVSITEAYLDAMSLAVVSKAVDLRVPTQSLLLDEWEISSTSNWRKREDAFEDYQGFKLKSCSQYKEVQAAVWVRNSIAHALGQITARQRTTRTLATEVARINVTVGGGRMHLSDDTFAVTEAACTAFIRDVDGRIPLA